MPSQQLPEDQFIHEGYRQHPWYFWGWLAVVMACSLLFWFGLDKYATTLNREYADRPFLRVTNREMSLFLWQNPSYMRVHAANNNGYLVAFDYVDKIGLKPEYADEFAIAPPELLFLYHTWERQIANEWPERPIYADELYAFLFEVSEWLPRYWPMAPKKYVELVKRLPKLGKENLSHLSHHELPLDVKRAYAGWRNYFFEGAQIEQASFTRKQVKTFLSAYPHYRRNYWCQIVGSHYLADLENLSLESNEYLSQGTLAPFLRIALYNWSIESR